MRVGGFDIKVVPDELLKAGLVEIGGLEEFREKLSPPRPIFIYVAAGPIVDRVIDNLTAYLERGDIIMDAGNSYCADSIRRHKRMAEGKSHFTDPGTSGGMEGTRHGACPRAGGGKEPIARAESLPIEPATPGGCVHAGPPGGLSAPSSLCTRNGQLDMTE